MSGEGVQVPTAWRGAAVVGCGGRKALHRFQRPGRFLRHLPAGHLPCPPLQGQVRAIGSTQSQGPSPCLSTTGPFHRIGSAAKRKSCRGQWLMTQSSEHSPNKSTFTCFTSDRWATFLQGGNALRRTWRACLFHTACCRAVSSGAFGVWSAKPNPLGKSNVRRVFTLLFYWKTNKQKQKTEGCTGKQLMCLKERKRDGSSWFSLFIFFVK